MINMNPSMEEETYSLLKRCSNIVIASLKEIDHMEDEEFFFHLSNLSIFDLGNVRTFSELVETINPHGEICEGKGYRQYQKELLDSMTISEKNHEKLSFIIPVLDGERKFNLLLNMSYDKVTKTRVLLFSQITLGGNEFDVYLHASFKDRLTGLFNFSVLQEHIRKNETDSYLCLFDFNKFKSINDTYGHAFGDLVLQDLAQYLIHISCIGIIFYRRSGDEFFILAQDGKENALKFVDLIENHLENLSKEKFKDYDFESSAAFGMVHLQYENHGAFNLQNNMMALKLADYAMYQAKANHEKIRIIENEEAKILLADQNIDKKVSSLIAKIRR